MLPGGPDCLSGLGAADLEPKLDEDRAGDDSGEPKLPPGTVQQLYEEHAGELRRFLLGVLRDSEAVADAMQAALVKAIEQGHTARDESRKAWLFRVAYHEALAIRRREATGARVLETSVWHVERLGQESALRESAAESAARREEAEAVRDALARLPAELQAVVRLRIHENLTFAEIAARLEIPLGTALTRMRTALAKLKTALGEHRP
ncbi:MAG: sigma-70 family RNA polymerase sigma factor [Planctomycetota bacterium]|nr:MAG: sigma-70 family RNA polymerase sigma factor [Planctomycetota bacterium]